MQAHHTCLQTPSSSTLDALNEDVLKLIVDRLHPAALRNLASSSHKLRDICLPVLFSRCTVDIKRHRIGYSSLPEEVRVRVRHLTHLGPLGEEEDVEYFEALLDHLPAVQSVTIKNAAGQIPWGIWKACISRPHIESFSYDARRYDLAIPPFPSDEVETTCVFLQKFSYTTSIWRELINSAGGLRHLRRRPIDMQRVLEFERQCLSPIVLKMSKTAVSFTLPLESTPVSAMAKLPWPNLKELNLHGRFLEAAQVKQIQHLLLQSLPSLARLSILAARTSEVGRPPFLPHPASNTSGSSSEPLFSQLRALEIAYFDPMDGMFSILMPMLSHLALRDYPRVHHNYGHGLPVGEGSRQHLHTPLLLDSEILYILRRMQLPLLTSLEIVYGVTDEVSDNELLSYIVDAFPHLEHLEIHRYRRRRNMLTFHKPITEILSRAQSLRIVRLNLDFHDDTQLPYYGHSHLHEKWSRTFRYERGPEIVQAMQACPLLEYVAILLHDFPSSFWVEFHPSRCPERPEPRCMRRYGEDYSESEDMDMARLMLCTRR